MTSCKHTPQHRKNRELTWKMQVVKTDTKWNRKFNSKTNFKNFTTKKTQYRMASLNSIKFLKGELNLFYTISFRN